ncbi:LysM peptidoglycan-binding domain-containing protein [Winslowiella iniecta]|nr:LysM peptidoglycan-binding domain-containing protein [Winslowiella iniecta]
MKLTDSLTRFLLPVSSPGALTESVRGERSPIAGDAFNDEDIALLEEKMASAGENWHQDKAFLNLLSEVMENRFIAKEISKITGGLEILHTALSATLTELTAHQKSELGNYLTSLYESRRPMLNEFRDQGYNTEWENLSAHFELLKTQLSELEGDKTSEDVRGAVEALLLATEKTLSLTPEDKTERLAMRHIVKVLMAQNEALLVADFAMLAAGELLQPEAAASGDYHQTLAGLMDGLRYAEKKITKARSKALNHPLDISADDKRYAEFAGIAGKIGLAAERLEAVAKKINEMKHRLDPHPVLNKMKRFGNQFGDKLLSDVKTAAAIAAFTPAGQVKLDKGLAGLDKGIDKLQMGAATAATALKAVPDVVVNIAKALPGGVRQVGAGLKSQGEKAATGVEKALIHSLTGPDRTLIPESPQERAVNEKLRVTVRPLLVAMERYQRASGKMMESCYQLDKHLTWSQVPESTDKTVQSAVRKAPAATAVRTAEKAGAKETAQRELREVAAVTAAKKLEKAATKKQEKAELKENALAVLREMSASMSGALAETDLHAGKLGDRLVKMKKQHPAQALKLDIFQQQIDKQVKRFRSAAQQLERAVQDASDTTDKVVFSKAFAEASRAVFSVVGAVGKIELAVTEATGKNLDLFSLDTRIALDLGVFCHDFLQDALRQDPDTDLEMLKEVITELFINQIADDFSKGADPDGHIMVGRAVEAFIGAIDGNLLRPRTTADVLAKTLTPLDYLAKTGHKTLIGQLTFAAVEGSLTRLISFLPRNIIIPNLSVLKAMAAPATLWFAYKELMATLMPGDPFPIKEFKQLVKRRAVIASIQALKFLLPKALKSGMSAGLTAYALSREGVANVASNVLKQAPQDLTWAGIWQGGIKGVNAVTARSGENKLNELVGKINTGQAGDHETRELHALLKKGGGSDEEITAYITYLKAVAASENELPDLLARIKKEGPADQDISRLRTLLNQRGVSDRDINDLLARIKKTGVSDKEIDDSNALIQKVADNDKILSDLLVSLQKVELSDQQAAELTFLLNKRGLSKNKLTALVERFRQGNVSDKETDELIERIKKGGEGDPALSDYIARLQVNKPDLNDIYALLTFLESWGVSDSYLNKLHARLKKEGISSADIQAIDAQLKTEVESDKDLIMLLTSLKKGKISNSDLDNLRAQLKVREVSDKDSTDLITLLSKGEIRNEDFDALRRPGTEPVKTGRHKRAAGMGILSALERQQLLSAYGKGRPAKVDIVTPFELQQTIDAKKKVTTELNELKSQRKSLESLIKIESNSNIPGKEAEIAALKKQLDDVNGKIDKKEAEDNQLKDKVRTMQKRLDDSAEIRRRWDPEFLKIKSQAHVNRFNKGAIIRMSGRLHPETFISDYLEKILKNFSKEDRGELTSPDSKIKLRGIGSNQAGGNREITLMDLAMGKVSITDWDIIWDKNISMELREALNPGGANIVSDGGGYNRGVNWYTSTRPRPESLTTQISKAFKENVDAIKNNPDDSAAMVTYYESMFKNAAAQLFKDPKLEEFKGLLDDIQSGKIVGEHVQFYGYVLTEVVSVRINDKILAWDPKGSYAVIDNTEYGIQDKTKQEWIVNHLDANAQYKYRTEESRKEAFKFYDASTQPLARSTSQSEMKSPISTSQEATLGEDALRVVMHRAKDDMDSMVKTSGEYLLGRMIDLAAAGTGAAVAIGVGMAGGAMGVKSIWVMLCQVAAAGKLTLSKGLMMHWLTDNQKEREEILAAMPEELLTSMIVDGGLTLGPSLAKSMLPTLKLPWKSAVKDVNVMKETMFGMGGDSLGGRVSPMANEVASKLKQQPAAETPKSETPPPVALSSMSQINGMSGQTYVVQEGDNIYSMMVELGIRPSDLELLVNANSYVLNSIFDIKPGQVLIIPDSAISPIDRIHTTEAGDNLQDLSYKYYGFYGGWNYILLKNLNAEKIPFIDNTQPDIELNLPNSLFNGTFTVPDFVHRVQPGQTLEDIAYLYYDSHVGLEKLREANPGITDPLTPGTSLKISKYVYPEYFGYFSGPPLDIRKGLVQQNPVNLQRETPALNYSGRTGSFLGSPEQGENENNLARARSNPVSFPDNQDVIQHNQPEGLQYIVQPGDTFHALVSAFGIRPAQYAQFIAANGDALRSVTQLEPGNTLFIPDNIRFVNIPPSVENQQVSDGKASAPPHTDESRPVRRHSVGASNNQLRGRKYRVQQGESLNSVAKKLGIPHSKFGLLTQANKEILLPGNHLEAGKTIVIPDSARSNKDIIQPLIKTRLHTVRPGDNTARISWQFYGNYDQQNKIIADNSEKWITSEKPLPGVKIMLSNSRFDGNYAVAAIEHKVKAGETVHQLALRYYGNLTGVDIIRKNNLDINIFNQLEEGVILNIVDSVDPEYFDQPDGNGQVEDSVAESPQFVAENGRSQFFARDNANQQGGGLDDAQNN